MRTTEDMDRVYPAYREADVVVLASLLYYWFISGFLKNAFDRLFAIAECDPNYEGLPSVEVRQASAYRHTLLAECR